MRLRWIYAESLAERQRICEDLQVQAFRDVPYIPLGAQYFPCAYSKSISAPRIGFVQCYDVARV